MKILASRQKNNLKSTMFKILEKAAINDLDKEIDFTCQDKLKNSLLNGFTSLITSVNSPQQSDFEYENINFDDKLRIKSFDEDIDLFVNKTLDSYKIKQSNTVLPSNLEEQLSYLETSIQEHLN